MIPNKQNYPRRQQGLALWHILLLVVIAVSLTVCANKGKLFYFQQPVPILGKMPEINLPNMPDLSIGSNKNEYYEQPAVIRAHNQEVVNDDLFISKTDNTITPSKRQYSDYELQYPRNLPADHSQGYYTVQVFSGYNSKSAYDMEKALKRDGYRAYVAQNKDNQGILFKVRIGKYTNRADAFAMNSKVRQTYPKQMSKSFVLLKHP